MAISLQTKNQHLLWRAAFGPVIENQQQLSNVQPAAVLNKLLSATNQKVERFTIAQNMYDGLYKGIQDLGRMQQLSQDQKMQLRKQSIDGIQNLNLSWLEEMVHNPDQLREKMTLFWHGHFACRVINIFFQQELLNTIRENALGNFGDLLRAVSKSAAMLSFLNNQQNKKQHPNENFAREVMELFTMGRGHYTETDVKEAARAFTGWGFDGNGAFQERFFFHDTGRKTFLQKTGNFTGDDILNIILEQEATAYFITQKIYTSFVHEVPDPEHIQVLAKSFYQSGYDLKKLMTDIFSADWFYEEKNVSTHIKSPIELLIGIRRMLPLQTETPEYQLLFERALGQLLFYPPNVAGWPGGKTWIDSSTLVMRMRLAQIMANANEFSVEPKEDDDVSMGMEKPIFNKKLQKLITNVDWTTIVQQFEAKTADALYMSLQQLLLQTTHVINPQVIKEYLDYSSKESFIKTTMIQLMSLPEYQVC